jgi:hypothetical protein
MRETTRGFELFELGPLLKRRDLIRLFWESFGSVWSFSNEISNTVGFLGFIPCGNRQRVCKFHPSGGSYWSTSVECVCGRKANIFLGLATARRGYHTPRGAYHVTALDIDAYSSKYDASMPFAVCFIRGDYCIHAGHSIGQNASHGCIRLARPNAIKFFYLVSANRNRTTIVVR